MRFRLNHLVPNEVPVAETPAQTSSADEEKVPSTTASALQANDEIITNKEFQHGVQAAEAITQMWTKNHLIFAYVLIWVIEFIMTFASGLTSTLTPYVTSSFEAHSLTATTSIISGLIAGLIKLPYAKVMDIWGRPQAFCIMVASWTLGMVMMAGCQDVKTYCAAQVFYYVGYNGIGFTLTIFIADTTQLKNRAWWIAFSSSPWIVTVWATGPAAQSVLSTIGFRWGFGIWAIILPIICAPLFALFYFYQKKAEKLGLIQKIDSGRSWTESFLYYCREFDVIGLLLIATGLALFLLTFSLYSYQKGEWKSPLVICFIIFGGLFIIAFTLYEIYVAPVTFIPWALMKDRTVFFTYSMVASLYCAWYIWDSYFYSMLIVVFNQSITNASYISNIYTIGSCFWALVVGVVIKYNGRLKWLAMYFGVPVTILAVGLMIKFRQPDTNIGYIVMTQIFIAFGGGTLVMCEQMTVMAVSSHQHIPAVLAIEAMIASIGGAIGSTIAAALWTGIFPVKLAELLPSSAQADFKTIYGSLTVQSSYPIGSETRTAINQAYGDTQKLMLICATCLYSVTLVSTILWRDINVKEIKQIKGRIW